MREGTKYPGNYGPNGYAIGGNVCDLFYLCLHGDDS